MTLAGPSSAAPSGPRGSGPREGRPSAGRWLLLSLAVLAFIVVPYALWNEPIERFSSRLLAARAPAWAAGPAISLLLAADVVLPIPSSLVSTAAGAVLGFWGGALASWVGMMAGCVGGYWLGLRAGRPGARRVLSEADQLRFEGAASRHGAWFIALFRAVPVLAEASVLFAGMARLPLRPFLATSALANLAVALTYAAVGRWAVAVDSFLIAFAGSIVLPGAFLWRMRARRPSPPPGSRSPGNRG